MKNKLAERGISIQELSEFALYNGNIVLTGAMSPILTAQEVIYLKFPELKLTKVYRLSFDDERCTTWEGSDTVPVLPDLIVMELNFLFTAIGADFGISFLPILFHLKDKPILLSESYKKYNWIKMAPVEDFELICKYVESKFDENKQAYRDLYVKLK